VLWAVKDDAPSIRVSVADEAAVVLRRGGRAVAWDDARAGDRVEARGATTLRLGRATISVDASTRLRLSSEDAVALEGGRVTFDVSHAGSPLAAGSVAFSVDAAPVRVDVRGTRFLLERYAVTGDGAAPLLLVDVRSGVVEAGGTPVRAGERRLFEGRVPRDLRPGALGASLEAGDEPVRAGGVVEVRLVFSNPGDAPAALPAPDSPQSPWFVGVTSPSGASVPYRVSRDMVAPSERPSVVPPRGRAALTLRFARGFETPGTYRLKVLFPSSAGPGGTGNGEGGDLVLQVR
jgi:hypothetical protein